MCASCRSHNFKIIFIGGWSQRRVFFPSVEHVHCIRYINSYIYVHGQLAARGLFQREAITMRKRMNDQLPCPISVELQGPE